MCWVMFQAGVSRGLVFNGKDIGEIFFLYLLTNMKWREPVAAVCVCVCATLVERVSVVTSPAEKTPDPCVTHV